jgi:hypothetical protein
MKIAICASIAFTPQIKEAADKLKLLGHKVEIPLTSRRIINGEITLEQFLKENGKNGSGAIRKIKDDIIRYYFKLIKKTDAVLALNFDKNGIKNYIGGNTFLEMGFAHVLNKKIYLFHDIPTLPYTDEIKAMQPIVINENLKNIK